MSFKIAVNNQLFLKIPTEEDADKIYNLIDQDRDLLGEWLPWVQHTKSVRDTKDNIQERIAKFKKGESAEFIMYLDGEPVGSVGFVNIDKENSKGEVGYWLSSDHVGKGLMTRSVQAVISYGFEDLDLNKITIKCAVQNEKSAAIAQRLGFTHEGTLRADRFIGGDYHDTLVFGLLKKGWSK